MNASGGTRRLHSQYPHHHYSGLRLGDLARETGCSLVGHSSIGCARSPRSSSDAADAPAKFGWLYTRQDGFQLPSEILYATSEETEGLECSFRTSPGTKELLHLLLDSYQARHKARLVAKGYTQREKITLKASALLLSGSSLERIKDELHGCFSIKDLQILSGCRRLPMVQLDWSIKDKPTHENAAQDTATYACYGGTFRCASLSFGHFGVVWSSIGLFCVQTRSRPPAAATVEFIQSLYPKHVSANTLTESPSFIVGDPGFPWRFAVLNQSVCFLENPGLASSLGMCKARVCKNNDNAQPTQLVEEQEERDWNLFVAVTEAESAHTIDGDAWMIDINLLLVPVPQPTWRAGEKQQLIHSDVCGPMSESTLNGSLYYWHIDDDLTRF
ncbi:hypothetical protein M569_00060 [Genlisea aurea]|uniref:Uncharacterized protein n=1 Tax=Genlisea aurea TaxID=192259 RepID=S8D5I6_9LAMI|nr:hypothetical protein M569_00060 [Genlisea aurea]